MIIKEFNNNMSKENITLQCLEVAESTSFPTDYDDVYNHLFENEDLLKLFVLGNDNLIKGFAVFDYLNSNYNILYLSGMVLDSCIQGTGISKELLKKGLELLKGDIITLRTRNPRMYQALVKSLPNYGSYPKLKVPSFKA